ncbi:MAG: class I SAM-dependent methyltransferase [Elusimicrobia bacterium]|nr:class I SAM-dependent methyltransferase [Elusimicrobiota bacterium]
MLEVGCGKGRFLEAAKRKGYRVYGIEPSSRSFAVASRLVRGFIAPIGFEDIATVADFPREYEFVMLWHVLEHLDAPDSLLAQARRLLSDGGRLVIAVPNFASLQARVGGANWYHLDPPRHVHHFTPRSLRLLAEKCGFEVEKISFDSFYQDYIGDLITVVNRLLPGKNVIFNGLRRNPAYLDRYGAVRAWAQFAAAAWLSALFAPPIFLVTLLTQWGRRSGTMIAIMKPVVPSRRA